MPDGRHGKGGKPPYHGGGGGRPPQHGGGYGKPSQHGGGGGKPPQHGGGYGRPSQPGGTPGEPQLAASFQDIDLCLRGNAQKIVEVADKIGKQLQRMNMSTSQVRAVLDEIQRMKAHSPNKLHLLRPKLAYAAGRHGPAVRFFQRHLDIALQRTAKNPGYFKGLKDLVEAIVAYHRYHGGD
ncbi:MAG: type III-A CRISPR-associated protein Csm2 [Elusimicrobiota bacterium]